MEHVFKLGQIPFHITFHVAIISLANVYNAIWVW